MRRELGWTIARNVAGIALGQKALNLKRREESIVDNRDRENCIVLALLAIKNKELRTRREKVRSTTRLANA